MEVDKLASKQFKLGQSICSLLTNIKKDSRSRKTEEYIKKKREILQEYWSEFTQRHSRLLEIISQSHDYMTKNFYKQTHEVVIQIEEYLSAIEKENTTRTLVGPSTPSALGPSEVKNETNETTTEVKRLLKKQKIKFHAINKLLDEINNKIETDQSRRYWEYKKDILNQQWFTLQQLHEELLMADEELDVENYIESGEFDILDMQVQEVVPLLYEKMNTEKTTHEVPLPHVNIPTFSGNYHNWSPFRDLFLRIIHNNKKLSNVEKMEYLKTSLSGEASKILQNLKVSDSNYETAWELLNKRYNNKRMLFISHLNNILHLRTIEGTAEDLKRIHDTTVENLRAIDNIGVSTENWETIIAHIIMEKLDKETLQMFDQSLQQPKEVIQLQELLSFLETRFQSLELQKGMTKKTESNQRKSSEKTDWKKSPTERSSTRAHHTNSSNNCIYCRGTHLIYSCQNFSNLSTKERNNFISSRKLCPNCLVHDVQKKCWSFRSCMKCKKPHHTLLHYDQKEPKAVVATNLSTKLEDNNCAETYNGVVSQTTEILLATAIVKAQTAASSYEYLRALIDPGSQSSFITEEAVQTLGIPKQKVCVHISGVGSSGAGTAKAEVKIDLRSRFPSTFRLQCDLLVLRRLTSNLPREELVLQRNPELNNYLLADPTYNIPGPIDIIIGADVFTNIIKDGVMKLSNGYLAQNTEFGWILSGRNHLAKKTQIEVISMISTAEEDKQLTKFWEIEEISNTPNFSKEDQFCEELYKNNVHRNKNGTYIVSLPFKENTVELGESRKKALARFLQMERKFAINKEFAQEYRRFMAEYEEMQHMVLVNPDVNPRYYIPHHAVFKNDSTTTKLRVVFDASSRTSTGTSLNDSMLTGPRIQEDLFQILLRWRKHCVALTADIEKMYRQIKIISEHQQYQTILWRYSTEEPIKEYTLTTVTYGTSSAPFLAVRTLQQLATDEKKNFPRAADIATKDFYVDDLLTGADSSSDAKALQEETISLLQTGGFKLRKWKSNDKDLVSRLPETLQEKHFVEIEENDTKKTLGVLWAPIGDKFKYKVQLIQDHQPTKRSVLRQIARLYDPLGLLAPVIIRAKLLIQDLWKSEINWDQLLPEVEKVKWKDFLQDLMLLDEVEIPRWINYHSYDKVELHGFCDASEKAYGAMVYSKIKKRNGQVFTTLLTAKSKVAPLKMKKTLPRLELCGAVLLAKLIKQVSESLAINDMEIYAWTDSMIALAWIKGNPERWKSFVSNRVNEILETTTKNNWKHVKSEDNPADLVSRGLAASNLLHNELWWNGPHWLKDNISNQPDVIQDTTEEMKPKVVSVNSMVTDDFEITTRFSSLQTLIRVTAYCLRFARKCQRQHIETLINTSELRQAQNKIIQIVQRKHFKREIMSLEMRREIDKKSQLLHLTPFLDENGILRVGGRLQNSSLQFDEKHPIIIPHEDHLSTLIIQDAHQRTLHGGNQLTLAVIRRKYWIIRGKTSVRKILRNCITCHRFKANPVHQIMGNLPEPRVNPSPPFVHAGIDYAGPIQIRMSKGRGNKTYKGYIAIFICMATKGIHLEAVSDMTTDAFLAAFKRFQARRGHCAHIYSDNGTTFVGAQRILDKELMLAMKQHSFLQPLASEGTTWHFIPPRAPHFGGLWESGVKSTKHHLKRVVGDNTLTFEELTTVLYQIEACLNSRPLVMLHDDPHDFVALTPAHLLIGRPLMMQADTADLEPTTNVTSRWKLVQKMKRDFWKVWSSEYLHQLQQRYKWPYRQENLAPGDLVLIKEEPSFPMKWPLARITEVHKGKDDNIRVVTLKRGDGSLQKRPIVKLCPLPKMDKEEHQPQQYQQHEQRYPKRRANAHWSTNIFLIFMSLLTICSASFTIKHPTSGLYIESIGEAYVERGRLRINVKVNGTTLLDHNATINKIISQIKDVCWHGESMSIGIDCKLLVNDLERQGQELQHQMKIVTEGRLTRQRRGLLGDLMQSLFGVNDEVYRDISQLDHNQKRIIETSKHQAAIMVNVLSAINDTKTQISRKINHLTDRFNQGLRKINDIMALEDSVDGNKLNIHILVMVQLAQGLIMELEGQCDRLQRISDHKGNIRDFISSKEWNRLTLNITKGLPSGVQIHLNSTSTTELTYEADTINIFGYFYLMDGTPYQIIAATPIPKRVENNIYITLDIGHPMVAMDYNHQIYFKLSSMELQEAVKIKPNVYLCSPAIINKISTNSNCLIDTIFTTTVNNTCSHHKFHVPGLMWKRLYLPNTWLFIAIQPTRIAVICNGEREDIWLNNTGIIQVAQECYMESQKNVLKPKLTIAARGIAAFHMPVNLNVTMTLPPKKKKPLELEPYFKEDDEFGKILHEEFLLQEDETSAWETIKPHVTTIGVGTLILIVCGIILLLVILRMRRGPNQPTFVLPRQDVHTE